MPGRIATRTVATPFPTVLDNGPSGSAGGPTISGTARTTFTLTCNPGVWRQGYGHALTYQWMRDAGDIAGATNPTYVCVLADETHKLRCRVTGTNAFGSRSVLSPQTATVTA